VTSTEPAKPAKSIFSQWSPSKLKTLVQCPLQYYFKYVIKKVSDTPQTDTVARDSGNSLHQILEYTFKNIPLDIAVSSAKEAFPLSGEIFDTHVVPYIPNIVNFKHRIDDFSTRNPIRKIVPEMKLGVRKDWSACGFFDSDVYFRGIVDLTLLMENEDIITIDHKSGGTAEYSLKNYESQLRPYKVLQHSKFPGRSKFISGIHFIREGTVKLGEPTEVSEVETHLRAELDFSILDAVQTVVEQGFFKHKRGPYCKYCDFDTVCKAKEYKQFEEESRAALVGIEV